MKQSDNKSRNRPDGKSIVILGGYGAVGAMTAQTLGAWFPGRVVVAGRDLSKAVGLARSSAGKLKAARVDVDDPTDVEQVLDDAAVVVMCVERANVAVAQACLERGVHYVDISASPAVLQAIASLDALAERHAATAVLSVGVAPGLTNLLAHHCVERLPSAETIDISLLLGQGGNHGVDSVRWIVQQLTRSGGQDRSDAGRARVRLTESELRTVYPFPFSDQYTISDSLKVRATTRICFDSTFVTSILFALRTARLFSLIRLMRAQSLLVSILSRVRLGSDRFVVHVVASDSAGTVVSSTVKGCETCDATSVITAQTARALYTTPVPSGVLHIDQVMSPRFVLDELDKHLMTVEHSGPLKASKARHHSSTRK